MQGKRVLVTGATAGIGRAVSLRLAKAGCKVLALGRRQERLQELAKEAAGIESLVCDLTQDLSRLRDRIQREPVDILINNAGLAVGRDTFQDTSVAAWQKMLDTNVKALFEVTQICLASMIQKKSGDIVNIGSIAGMRAYAGGAVYCATKAAVVQLTDALRLDLLGTGIRVIGIHPGMVETEFSEVRLGDKQKAKEVYAGMRPLLAADIAEAIYWSLQLPQHVNIQSMLIMPTDQGGVGAIHRQRNK